MNAENIESSQEIFSSTGRLGVSRRPFDRLYVNATHFSSDISEFTRNIQRLLSIGRRHSEKIGRTIFRGLVSPSIMHYVAAGHGIQGNLEVTLPVREFTHDDSYLIYVGSNRYDRQQLNSTEAMITETENQRKIISRPPLERVQEISNRGYKFTNEIADSQIDQLLALWENTFGWSRNEIENLQKRLVKNKEKKPSERDVWFSAIINSNRNIISVAMAERLAIPTENNGKLHLVESTEWDTEYRYGGRGIMTANLAMLNTQILEDFAGSGEIPLIYAECNFQSRSDRAGHGAGYQIPSRVYAPQIIPQNVLVQDGQAVPDGKLRDFTFMYLPMNVISTNYDAWSRNQILQVLEG